MSGGVLIPTCIVSIMDSSLNLPLIHRKVIGSLYTLGKDRTGRLVWAMLTHIYFMNHSYQEMQRVSLIFFMPLLFRAHSMSDLGVKL